jgi:5'(3')-deoxyribonucleotidase
MLLTDAAPRNVRVVEGIPVPFDAIAQKAEGRLLDWCMNRWHELKDLK